MRNVKNLGVALIALIITACTTVSVKPPSEMAVDHGLVFGTFHSPEVYGIQLRTPRGKRYAIYSNEQFTVKRQFSAWIAPGEYRISQLYSAGLINPNVITIDKDTLPLVKIKAGMVVDLGDLLPFNLGGGKFTLMSRARENTYVPKEIMDYPEMSKQEDFIRWSSEDALPISKMRTGSSGQGLIADLLLSYGESKQRGQTINIEDLDADSAFELLLAQSPPRSKLSVDREGNGYFGTTLGQIRYQQGKTWKVMNTGHLDAVVAVDASNKDRLVVALESGLLLSSSDFGISWKPLTRIKEDQVAFDIRSVNGTRYVSTWKPDKESGVKVDSFGMLTPTAYVYKLIEEELVLLTEVEGTNVHLFWAQPQIESVDSDLLIGMSPKTLVRVSGVNGESQVINLPKNFTGFSYNKGFLSIWMAGGAFSRAYVSSDMGSNWSDLPKPPYQPRYIHLDTQTKGYMWSVAMGLNSSSFKLDTLNAEDKSWDLSVKSDISCTQILMNFIRNEHFCVYPNGMLDAVSAQD